MSGKSDQPTASVQAAARGIWRIKEAADLDGELLADNELAESRRIARRGLGGSAPTTRRRTAHPTH